MPAPAAPLRDEIDDVSVAVSITSLSRSLSWFRVRRQVVSRPIRSWAPLRKSWPGSAGDNIAVDSDVGGANISAVADEPFTDGEREGMLQLSGECLSFRATLILAAISLMNKMMKIWFQIDSSREKLTRLWFGHGSRSRWFSRGGARVGFVLFTPQDKLFPIFFSGRRNVARRRLSVGRMGPRPGAFHQVD